MAGDWLKIESATPDKPEVFEIAQQLGIEPEEAFGRLFNVWRWFDQHTESGNADSVTAAYLDRISGVAGFTQAMEKVGWIIKGPREKFGYSLPNFDRHNGQTAKKRGLTAKRVATHRQRSTNDDVTHIALAREEKRRDIKSTVGQPDKSRADATAVLAYLNEQAGREYKPVNGNIGLIAARLKEGATVEDCKAVVDRKVNEWRGGEMDKYLRPATLFNATKFAQYQGETPRKPTGEVI